MGVFDISYSVPVGISDNFAFTYVTRGVGFWRELFGSNVVFINMKNKYVSVIFRTIVLMLSLHPLNLKQLMRCLVDIHSC